MKKVPTKTSYALVKKEQKSTVEKIWKNHSFNFKWQVKRKKLFSPTKTEIFIFLNILLVHMKYNRKKG